MQDNAITAFEALLRWNHPTRGLILPGEFIPVAEETGLLIPLGEWVLRKACAEAATWPDGIKIAVNLSAIQLKSRGLVQAVVSALASSGLPGNRLQLEITESILMQNTAATLSTLHQLRKLGVQIAMDDFGIFLAELSPELPLRQDQDRPLLRSGPIEWQRAACDPLRGNHAGQMPQDDLNGGRGGDGTANGGAEGGRLQ